MTTEDKPVPAETPLEFDDGEAATETPTIETPEEDSPPIVPPPDPLEPKSGGVPVWFPMPGEKIKIPQGRVVQFIRFPSKWTDSPRRGIPLPFESPESVALAGEGGLWRTCMCWPLDTGDERMAMARSMGDTNRFSVELVKQYIRVIDGQRADWSGEVGDANIEGWWNEIGGKNRRLLQGIWNKLHTHSPERLAAFFASCIEVRAPA
jgi:hypothetical protein